MEKRDQAKRLYLKGKPLKDIATELGIKYATVRKWKGRDGWPAKVSQSRPKRPSHESVTKARKEHALIPAPLNERQQLFCEIYVEIFNATVAYMKAYGTPRSSARTAGPRLLQNVAVRTYVQYLKSLKAQEIMAGINDLVELHMRIAFADYTDFAEFGTEQRPIVDKSGVPVTVEDANGVTSILTKTVNMVRLKNSEEVDGRMIAEVKTSKDGTSVKLRNQDYSMKWLSDYFAANPMDRHHIEYDNQRQRLERERFEHQKKCDEGANW